MNADFLFLFSGEKYTIWNIHKGRPHSNCWDHHQQTHLASLLLKGVIEIYRFTLTKISHSHVIMIPNWRASNNKKKPINHLFWFVARLVSKKLNSLCNFASLFYACYECENRFLPSQMDKWMDGGNSIKPVWERPLPGDTFAVSWRQ